MVTQDACIVLLNEYRKHMQGSHSSAGASYIPFDATHACFIGFDVTFVWNYNLQISINLSLDDKPLPFMLVDVFQRSFKKIRKCYEIL